MAEVENHFTVFIRLPFNRGNFVDPPPVSWSAAKEGALWDVISRQAKGNDIDWTELAENLDVTTPFLLQQAAWLYERQLSQVRAQMRKVGVRQSATPSPAPGSISGSMVGGQAMKRTDSGGSRVPSRISTQARDSPVSMGEGSAPGTPARARTSLPFRAPSGLLSSQLRTTGPASSPMSRQSSKEANTPTYNRSRRGSIQHQLSRSPAQGRPTSAESSDSENEVSKSKATYRRPNPSSTLRRTIPVRREHGARRPSLASNEDGDEEDDEDSRLFLPFANATESNRQSASHQDPGATLRGGFTSNGQAQRPTPHRRSTSERIMTTSGRPQQQQMTSSASSNSSGPTPTTARDPEDQMQANRPPQPLSPRHVQHQQALAAAGLSPRRRNVAGSNGRGGSDTSPSMGSSFSDLDEASVTQSALEEALLSNMVHHGNGNGMSSTNSAAGAVASRVSGISQALRSRYFDAQSGGAAR